HWRDVAVRAGGQNRAVPSGVSIASRSSHAARSALATRTPRRMSRLRLAVLAIILAAACSPNTTVSATERQAIVDSLTRQVQAAYDLSKPNAEQRLLSLYPPN